MKGPPKKGTSTVRSRSEESPPVSSENVPLQPIQEISDSLPRSAITKLTILLHEISGKSDSKLEMIAILSRGPRNVGELSSVAALTGSAVSQHLNRLKAHGIVENVRIQHHQQYRLKEGLKEEIISLIDTVFG